MFNKIFLLMLVTGSVVLAACTLVDQEKVCEVYFDGCNTCSGEKDGLWACTEMYCSPEDYSEPRCIRYSDGSADLVPEKLCQVDSDCLPAQCCHATDAVHKDFAPDCSQGFCTMDCQTGTLDCGQGEIKCLENQCTVVLYE